MIELGLLEFAKLTAELIHKVDHSKRESLDAGAEIIEKEAKRVIGTYDYGWPPLAESTVAKKGADTPLLETGAMRDSLEHTVVSDNEAQVGSNDDKAIWHELGTSHIPPRPFLSQAAVHKEKDVAHEIGRHVVKALLPSGMSVPESE